MAELSITPHARGQFAALAQVRWRIFVNSLRTTMGAFELLSRVVIGLVVTLAGLGGAAGLGGGAWFSVSRGKAEWIALLLWPVFLFWQFFPVVATAFTENLDAATLLRFPLTYRSYVLVGVVYGSLDIATVLGSLWSLGIAIGIGAASPALLPFAGLVLLVFVAVNILLSRMLFAWLERWLAQRRTRELMGILFFLFVLSFQLIGPAMSRFGPQAKPGMARVSGEVVPIQRVLPPGLAAAAIAATQEGRFASGLGFFGLLCAYGGAFLGLLNLRLRAQFRGESLGESEVRASRGGAGQGVTMAWAIPGLTGPVAALFEKELRYFFRSGPMLLTLVMPAFMLVILRASPMRGSKYSMFFDAGTDFAFPIGAAYALLMLTNLVYNHFGADGGGIQFLFAAPVRWRSVVLGKNLAHVAVLMLGTALVWGAASLLYHPPALQVALATLAWMLFAAPANLAAGNLLSLYAPKKVDYAVFGRQRASRTTVLLSFALQLGICGTAALVVWLARLYGSPWFATPIFLGLAVISLAGYAVVLGRAERMAMARQEILMAELCRG